MLSYKYMKKKYTATKEEIEYIKEILSDILHFWSYANISVNDEFGGSMSMSKETFFEDLERKLS